MKNRLLKSYLWLPYCCIQFLYAAIPPLSSTETTSAACCYQRTEIKGEITVEENAKIGKTVYSLDKPSGFEYNSSQSTEPESFKVINDTLQVQIEVISKLYSGLSQSLKIGFISSDINCGSVMVFTIILTVPEITKITTRLPLNVNVSICQPGAVVHVKNVTCDSRNYTTCQPHNCRLQDNEIFWVSEGPRIQANVHNVNFSRAYDLFVDCDVVFESNGLPMIDDMIKLQFVVTFQKLCGLLDETLSHVHQTESTTSTLISNLVASSATLAKATTAVSAWQNKSDITASITQISSPVDGTSCNPNDSSSEGFVVVPTMVAVLATVATIIGISTAVGCYCLGYKRCVPLPIALCHRGMKVEEPNDAEHNTATA